MLRIVVKFVLKVVDEENARLNWETVLAADFGFQCLHRFQNVILTMPIRHAQSFQMDLLSSLDFLVKSKNCESNSGPTTPVNGQSSSYKR